MEKNRNAGLTTTSPSPEEAGWCIRCGDRAVGDSAFLRDRSAAVSQARRPALECISSDVVRYVLDGEVDGHTGGFSLGAAGPPSGGPARWPLRQINSFSG